MPTRHAPELAALIEKKRNSPGARFVYEIRKQLKAREVKA